MSGCGESPSGRKSKSGSGWFRPEADNQREPGTANRLGTMKSGYLYVLVHPSDPDLYKIGVTILKPEKRLAQHNSQLEKYAGQVVNETGQKWGIKTFVAVPDPYWAEKAFWGATPISLMPGG